MNPFPPPETPIHLYWFSGSGNTLRAAETFAQRLRELGRQVELRPLETATPEDFRPEAVFALAFPTYCFSVPECVRKFVRALPRADGTPAVMLGTHGAFSGGVRGPMKRMLRGKGFRCLAARIISMPDSFFPFTGQETNAAHMTRALEKVRCYAEDFHAGQGSWPRDFLLSDIFGAFFAGGFYTRKWCGKWHTSVHPHAKKCTRCGTCVRLCPTGALQQKTPEDTPRPVRGCANCLRCVAVCPSDAMRHLIGFSPYRSEPAADLRERFRENR